MSADAPERIRFGYKHDTWPGHRSKDLPAVEVDFDDTSVRYIRGDLYDKLVERVAELERELAELKEESD